MYKVEFEGLTGALKAISGIVGLSFWEPFTSPPHGTSGEICLTGFGIFAPRPLGLFTWLVYPITEGLSFTHSIHRNYHFTNSTVGLKETDSGGYFLNMWPQKLSLSFSPSSRCINSLVASVKLYASSIWPKFRYVKNLVSPETRQVNYNSTSKNGYVSYPVRKTWSHSLWSLRLVISFAIHPRVSWQRQGGGSASVPSSGGLSDSASSSSCNRLSASLSDVPLESSSDCDVGADPSRDWVSCIPGRTVGWLLFIPDPCRTVWYSDSGTLTLTRSLTW